MHDDKIKQNKTKTTKNKKPRNHRHKDIRKDQFLFPYIIMFMLVNYVAITLLCQWSGCSHYKHNDITSFLSWTLSLCRYVTSVNVVSLLPGYVFEKWCFGSSCFVMQTIILQRWRLYILPESLANLTQPSRHKESQIFTIFVPVLRTLSSLGLKIL